MSLYFRTFWMCFRPSLKRIINICKRSNYVALKIRPRFALTGQFSAPLNTLISAPHLPIYYASFFSCFFRSFFSAFWELCHFSFSLFFLRKIFVVSISNGYHRIELIFAYQLSSGVSNHYWCISGRYYSAFSSSVFIWKTVVLSWGLRGRYTTVHIFE